MTASKSFGILDDQEGEGAAQSAARSGNQDIGESGHRGIGTSKNPAEPYGNRGRIAEIYANLGSTWDDPR